MSADKRLRALSKRQLSTPRLYRLNRRIPAQSNVLCQCGGTEAQADPPKIRRGVSTHRNAGCRIAATPVKDPGAGQLASVPRGRRRLMSWAGEMVIGNGRSTVNEAVVTATVA